MQWFYADDSDQQHEVDEEKLIELANSGTIRSDTLVWNETMPDWQPCQSIRPELFGGNPLPPALSPQQIRQVTAQGPSNANYNPPLDTVAVCSLVFGVMGLLCIQIFSPVAVVCGHIALKRAKETENQSTNRGLAIGGLVTGYLGIALVVAVIGFYVVFFAAAAASGDLDF